MNEFIIRILATLLLFWIMYMPESKRKTPTYIFKCSIGWRLKIDLDQHQRSQIQHIWNFEFNFSDDGCFERAPSYEEKGVFIANACSLAQNGQKSVSIFSARSVYGAKKKNIIRLNSEYLPLNFQWIIQIGIRTLTPLTKQLIDCNRLFIIIIIFVPLLLFSLRLRTSRKF